MISEEPDKFWELIRFRVAQYSELVLLGNSPLPPVKEGVVYCGGLVFLFVESQLCENEGTHNRMLCVNCCFKKSSRLRLESFCSLLNRVEEENNYILPALTFIFNEMFLFT